MTKPVIIEYQDGQTYAVTSAAKAKSVHPDAKIVRYEDGTPYEEPKSASSAKTATSRRSGASRPKQSPERASQPESVTVASAPAGSGAE